MQRDVLRGDSDVSKTGCGRRLKSRYDRSRASVIQSAFRYKFPDKRFGRADGHSAAAETGAADAPPMSLQEDHQ
jgi:hypothetical protein